MYNAAREAVIGRPFLLVPVRRYTDPRPITQTMSVAEFPPRAADVSVEREHTSPRSTRLTLTYEQLAYVALFVIALLAHLWGLGDRAYHHDETHHGYFSWRLYQGQGYVHDPLLHGPFLYFINAFVYFLFGDTNFTGRLSVALFGSVLVVLPYLIRRELGRGAAQLAAVYLLVSPAFLYVGRFIRHDTFAITFEILTLIGIVRYASTRQSRWLYLIAAALGLMIATMESFFLFVAIMLPLVAMLFFWRVWKPGVLVAGAVSVAIAALVFVLPAKPVRTGDQVVRLNGSYVCPAPGNLNPPNNPMEYEPGRLFPPLPTADNNYGLCVRNQPDNSFSAYFAKLGQFFLHPAILLAIGVLLFGAGAMYVLIWRTRGRDGLTQWERAREEHDGTFAAFASLGKDNRVLIALTIFLAIYGLFFSAFLMNPVGLISGATGSVLYWLAQHDVQRGGQPGYYYLMLLAVYEPLVLLWSTVGLVMVGAISVRRLLAVRAQQHEADSIPQARRDGEATIDWSLALPAILAWWSVLALFIYSWAGEKMPWLTVHVALPLTLLGAWALAKTLRWGLNAVQPLVVARGDNGSAEAWEPEQANDQSVRLPLRVRNQALPLYLAIVGVLVFFAFLLLSIAIPGEGQQNGAPWVLPLTLLVLAAVTLCYGLMRGAREAIGALALGVTLVTGIYTLRSSYQLNYLWGDVPREMMIFVQSTPDVARVMQRLEDASIRRTGSLAMPIWYDNETIWSWYTRRFTEKQQQQPQLSSPPGNEVKAVLMLKENYDAYQQNRDFLQGFVVQRYPLRWWFPEEQYRLPEDWTKFPLDDNSPLLMRVLRQPFDSKTAAQFWQYMLYRRPPGTLGSTDFVIAVRPELAQEIGLGTGAETP